MTHFQQAVDAFGPFCVRDQAQCLTRMATAQLALGNAEQACADAIRAVELAEGLHSNRFRDQLRGFTPPSLRRRHGDWLTRSQSGPDAY